jgi:hypothetical protein
MKWEDMQGYVNETCRKNLWRVEYLGYDLDDLKQESWLVYHECKKYYNNDSNAHFLTYYRIALHNKMKKLTKLNKMIQEHYSPFGDEDYEAIEGNEAEILLKVKLSFAPKIIKKILSLIENPPEKYADKFNQHTKGNRGFNSNTTLCEMLGVTDVTSMKSNVLKKIKDYIKS